MTSEPITPLYYAWHAANALVPALLVTTVIITIGELVQRAAKFIKHVKEYNHD